MATTPTLSIMEAEELAIEERRTRLIIAFSVFFGVAWASVLLRAYVRYFMVKNVAAEDWCMFAAMMIYTGYCINSIYGVEVGGTGRHASVLSELEIYIGLKTWYISQVVYPPLSAMVRTSVALFLYRVATERSHRCIIMSNLLVVYVINMIFMFVCVFQCNPPSYFYDQVLGLEGQCVDKHIVPNTTIIHSGIGALCDLVFALLPIAMLWNVQMNTRTKVSVAFLLGLGLVSGVGLLSRIPYVNALEINPDFLYETTNVAICSIAEPSLGIIAGSMATLRPLFKPFGFGRSTRRSTAYTNTFRRTICGPEGRMSRPYGPYAQHMRWSKPASNPVALEHVVGAPASSTDRITRPDSSAASDFELPYVTRMTSIVSNKEHQAEDCEGISVHTSIRTESIRGWKDARRQGMVAPTGAVDKRGCF